METHDRPLPRAPQGRPDPRAHHHASAPRPPSPSGPQALETVTRLHLPLARSLAHRYAGKGSTGTTSSRSPSSHCSRRPPFRPRPAHGVRCLRHAHDHRRARAATSVTTAGWSGPRAACRSVASWSPTPARELEQTPRPRADPGGPRRSARPDAGAGQGGAGGLDQPASGIARRDDRRRAAARCSTSSTRAPSTRRTPGSTTASSCGRPSSDSLPATSSILELRFTP